jgi:tRNA1(Val) A37 N6-methylase TrmN6
MTNIFKINDFSLFYKNHHDGGGTSFGQDFVQLLRSKYNSKKFNNCLDWCSGPGFIGLSLLVNNFCSNVSLMDSNNEVFDLTKKSLKGTRYKDFVKTFSLSKIKNLPSTEIFDLVVSNPPHFHQRVFWQSKVHQHNEKIFLDLNWEAHNEFFENIKSHLSDDGIILLQESQWACDVETFEDILNKNGLTVKNYYPETVEHFYPVFYLEITHK